MKKGNERHTAESGKIVMNSSEEFDPKKERKCNLTFTQLNMKLVRHISGMNTRSSQRV